MSCHKQSVCGCGLMYLPFNIVCMLVYVPLIRIQFLSSNNKTLHSLLFFLVGGAETGAVTESETFGLAKEREDDDKRKWRTAL